VRRAIPYFALLLIASVLPLLAEEPPAATIAVCSAIKDRTCEGAGVKFPANVGKLYAFSQASNVPDKLVHVWFRGSQELGRQAIKSPAPKGTWRGWSNITVSLNMTGDYRVEARDANGTILASASFTIVKPD